MAEEEEVLGKISDETYELDSDTKDEVAEKSQKYVPFWKLYRYAKCLDILLIIFALVCGVLSGVIYPAQIYILGITFNEFIDYAMIDIVKSGNYTQFDTVTSGNHTPMTPEDYGYFCDITRQSNLREYYFSDDPDGYLQDQTTTYAY